MTSQVSISPFDLELTVSDQGAGPAYLLLHGGAGARSMSGLATALAESGRAVLPSHPGFDGTRRPAAFHTAEQLAQAYAALIERLELKDVIAIGNSFGGWLAFELALLRLPQLKGVVALNAVGVDPGPNLPPIVDPVRLPPSELAAMAFHDPQKFGLRPPNPEAAAMMAENQRTLRVYAGEPFMFSATLEARLADAAVPAVFGWGESDRIVGLDYGRHFAGKVSGAGFETIARAGHFPHIERPDAVLDLIYRFRNRIG